MEHIVHSHIMKHLEEFNILSDNQHGFRAKRSTETQLIQTVHDLAEAMEKGETTHMAILDFSKAFDKVPHQRLLRKLHHHGIRNNILEWIGDFLIGRKQQVVCDGKTSDPAVVISGVPQGTVLGPLLFLLYINDLPDNLQCKTRLFADDCVIYSKGKTKDHLQQLQQDLSKLEEWQNKWLMEFNATKCFIMKITNKKDPPTTKFSFCGQTLTEVTSHPYLGVEIVNRLKWDIHINNTIKKASKILGFLRRNLWFCDRKVKTTAYETLVRPILEYSSMVWDPYTDKEINRLEMVQRKAARFCMNDHRQKSSVTDMLSKLDWTTLQERRKKARINMMAKIQHQLVAIDKDRYTSPATDYRSRRSHKMKLREPATSLNIFKYSYFPRTIRGMEFTLTRRNIFTSTKSISTRTNSRSISSSSRSYRTSSRSYRTNSRSYRTNSRSIINSNRSYRTSSRNYRTNSRSYRTSSRSYRTSSRSYRISSRSYRISRSYRTSSRSYRTSSRRSYRTSSRGYRTSSRS